MDDPSTILIVGPSNTGKTNYISRFWLAIDHNKSGLIVKDGWPPQADYFKDSADLLIQGRFAAHTPRGSFRRVELPFKSASLDKRGKLILPDVSGEDYKEVLNSREWGDEWETAVGDFAGCLVFLRIGALHAPLSWLEAQDLFAAHKPDYSHLSQTTTDQSPPTQTLLIEWLQIIRHALNEKRGYSFIPKIGIVVAAWDEMEKRDQGSRPEQIVRDYTPLLYQYIVSNNQRQFDFAVFGVSSTGGDLELDESFHHKYMEDPVQQGFVVFGSGDNCRRVTDITLPVAWILGTDLEGQRPDLFRSSS